MHGSAPYVGKGVQGAPQETEQPTTKNKRANGHRCTRRRWMRPGPETLVQQGWKLTIQVPISIKTTVMVKIGVQDPPGSRKQEKAAEQTRHQEGRQRYVMVGKNGSAPPNHEVKDLRQTIQTLRAENADLRQKLNDLIDELKALRTGQTNASPKSDLTLTATIGCQEFTTTMAAIKNALANLGNLISNIQDEARKDRERLVQLTAMKSRGKPYARPLPEYDEQPLMLGQVGNPRNMAVELSWNPSKARSSESIHL
ncbi:hypothetical protein HPB51_012876 [Rhipicephalus microplus]|uniref:Uncharacterized protein n=1 Tax=Rhipicephalus microplus TaxID=6941 RepID=A0A9J6DUU9_RHIMP|nr:hypothetical protein HPB51_012876 [Rhipicephalus microplus]